MNHKMTIGKLAQSTGARIDTIRYYELRGLLEEPERTDSGYRLYGPEAVTRLRFIKSAQVVGFTLEEIRQLLGIRVDDESSCDQASALAETKVVELKKRITEMQQMTEVLQELLSNCSQRKNASPCPILSAFEESALDHSA